MNAIAKGTAPLHKSRGLPGAAVRSRGFSQALGPFLGMVFGAGWIFGAVISPGVLQGKHAGVLLMLLAFGLAITWKRAVNILSRHEQGARGEEQVARVLEALPEAWRIFHGVPLVDRRMDHVLVSPDQVFTIETVYWEGQVRLLNGKLLHGEKAYDGYDLKTLKARAEKAADELGLPAGAVSPMLCVVGGRFADHPGEKEGVWLGEIQDLGPYLLQHPGAGLEKTVRLAVLERLEALLDGVASA